jgi:nitrogen fixation NifU-like protein
MADAAALYQAQVLDHQRMPRHYGALAGATHRAEGANALCGDHVQVEARMVGERVAAMGFTAEACAITTAAASMLSELAVGRSLAELESLQRRFAEFLAHGGEAAELGTLAALGELRRYPARRACAMLPFATLRAALEGSARASTEIASP